MNKNFYRVIFNKTRGIQMVVAEIAKTQNGSDKKQQVKDAQPIKTIVAKLKPITFFAYISFGLICFTSPLYANTIIADKQANKNQQAIILSTANGAAQVNIQAPNKNGLSHNKYSQFDVSEKGAILNNSTKNTSTQLAGYIQGNEFLKQSGSAKIILNEVNAKNPSQLNGYIEVAGQKAQVIIANSSGITCSGCGFINAERSTLTTGKPIIENGQLKGYLVEKGNITVTGKGMDGSAQDYTDLIARTVSINSSVWANNANVITGKNKVSADTNTVEPLDGDSTSKPEVAIDVSALGGMYAGKIRMVGTEKGVGVRNAGELGASAGSITISASGKIGNSGSMQAKQEIALTSTQDIDNTKQIYSQQNIQLTSQKQISNQGSLVAKNNIDLKAKTITSTTKSTIAAGVDEKGKLTEQGSITAKGNDIRLQGKNLATQSITLQGVKNADLTNSHTTAKTVSVSGENIDIQNAKLNIEKDITLTATGTIDSSGINAKTNSQFIAKADTILNNQAIISAKQGIALTGNDIENKASELASLQKITLIADNKIDATQSTIFAKDNIDIQGKHVINNYVQLVTENALTIQSTQLQNQGSQLEAKGDITISSEALDNKQATLLTEKALSIHTKNIDNKHAILSAKGDLSVVATDALYNDSAQLTTEKEMLVKADIMTNNQATLKAKENIAIQAGQLDSNASTMVAEKAITINATQLDHQQSTLTALGDISIKGQTINNNESQLATGQNITIQASQLDNQSAVFKSNGQIAVTANQFNNDFAKLFSNKNIIIQSDMLSNQSSLLNSVGNIDVQSSHIDNQKTQWITTGHIQIDGDNVNNQDADLRATQYLTINSNNIDNESAHLLTHADLTLHGININNDKSELNAAGSIRLDGQTVSSNDTTIFAQHDYQVSAKQLTSQDAKIQAKGNIDIQAESVESANALLIAEKQININADNLDLNTATVSAKGDLNITANNNLINHHANWISEGNIIVNALNYLNQQAKLSATKGIEIIANQFTNHDSELLSYGDIAITANNIYQPSSKLNALGHIVISGKQQDNHQALIISEQSITMTGDDMNNQQLSMQAQGDLSVTATNNINSTQSTMIAGQSLTLSGQAIDNQFAKIKAGHDLLVNGKTNNNTQALLLADNNIKLNASDLLINQQADIRAGNAILLAAKTINNQNSLLVTDDELTIKADLFDNQSSTVKAKGDIDITAKQMDNSLSTLVSQQNIAVNADDINNQSSVIKAQQDIQINVNNNLNNDSAVLLAGNQLLLSAVQLSNQFATLLSDSEMQITAAQFDNQQSKVVSGDKLVIHAQQIDNSQAELQAKGDVIVDSQTVNNHLAKIISDKNITIDATHRVNNQSAILSAKNKININTPQLDNQNAQWQSGDAISITALHFDNQAGYLKSKQDINIDATTVDNQSATLVTDKQLSINATSLDNQHATLSAKQDIQVTSNYIDNRQSLWLSDAGIQLTADQIDNEQAAMQAKDAMAISSTTTLNNHKATLIAGLAGISINANQFDNHEAELSTKGNATITANQLNNQLAQIVAEGDMIIHANDLNNQQANLQAKGNIELSADDIHNQHATLLSTQDIKITTTNHIDNNAAALTAQGGISIKASGDLDNQQASLLANKQIMLDVHALNNQQAVLKTQGQLGINASNINNTQATLSANETAIKTGQLQNSDANIITSQLANINAQSIINTNATILAEDVAIKAGSLTGDGKLLANNSLTLMLQNAFTNLDEIIANGKLTINSVGGIENQGKMLAGNTLNLTGSTITNQQVGEIESDNLNIKGTTLINYGLIDGSAVNVDLSGTFDNLNAARFYGDKVTIKANTLNNLGTSLTASVTPTLAARESMTLNVDTLNNRNHALMLSLGKFTIDATTINNHSSTIESQGDMLVNVGTLNNVNDLMTTELVEVDRQHIIDYSPQGSVNHYKPEEVKLYRRPKTRHKYLMLEALDGSFLGYRFYKYDYNSVAYQSQITDTHPGELISGQNLTIKAQTINNDNSKIIAGNELDLFYANALNNLSLEGIERTENNGFSIFYDRKKGHTSSRKAKYSQSTSDPIPYQDITETSFDLGNAKIEDHTIVAATQLDDNQRNQVDVGVNNDTSTVDASVTTQQQLTDITTTDVNVQDVSIDPSLGQTPLLADANINSLSDSTAVIQAASSSDANTAITLQNNSDPAQNAQVESLANSKPVTTISVVEPNTTLPNNSLYTVNKAVEKNYLIETDPKFTNYKKWLSSDYMFKQLQVDPNNIQKRLGDGYYEQRLIQQQITALTGQRYLVGYESDITQYQALMNAGVSFANRYNLVIGAELSAEQMSALTSDIVWFVSKTIDVNGQKESVLVPQVYVVNRPQITAEGALLAGKTINISGDGTIHTSGAILGKEQLSILANNVNNQGLISSQSVHIQAKDSIHSQGSVVGEKLVSLNATNDIVLTSTTSTTSTYYGQNKSINTVIDNVSSIQVSDGDIKLNAGRDIELGAALIVNNAAEGRTDITAGHDITLSTLTTESQQDLMGGKSNYRKTDISQVVGTDIFAKGDVTLQAGNDIHVNVGNINTDKALTLSAERDVEITSGQEHVGLIDHSKSTSKGLLSKGSTTTHIEVDNTMQQGSSLSGDSITINAGKDLSVTGSQVIGTHDVNLSAGNNIAIDAAEESYYRHEQTIEKKSGLMKGGSIGFTVGKEKSDLKQTDNKQAYVGSTVGSTEGSVNVQANKDLTIKGSDIIAKQDVTLQGENVTIESHDAQITYKEEYKYEKSGLTVALTGTVADVYDAAKAVEQAKKKDNDQLLALQSIKSALTAVQALEDTQLKNDKGDSQASIGVSITVGTQKTEREVNQEQHNVVGAGVSAGNNITITATGSSNETESQPKTDGDITIKGSEVRAGNDITLDANRDLNVIGAVNTQHSDRDEKSYGGGVGISLSIGGDKSGLRFTGNANFSQERENADGSAWSEGIVSAGNNLTAKTGNDTTLVGGQLEGDKITLDVGNNLNIQSLQDTDNYDYEKISASVSGSGGVGGFSANLSLSQTDIDSKWASVTDQSGIFAGKEGFDITVGNNTDLKGAVISSEATDTSKNKLDTGTISFSDIENKANFKVSHVSINVGTSGGGPIPGAPTIYHNSGSDHSTTQSAVEEGTLTVRNQDAQQQDVNTLSRDTENANNPLGQIFNKQKELDRMEALEMVKDIAAQAKEVMNKYDRIQAQNQVDKEGIQALAEKKYQELKPEDQAKTSVEKLYNEAYYAAVTDFVNNNKDKLGGMGSNVSKGIDAASSIITGLITGDITGGLAGASAPYLAEQIKLATIQKDDQGNIQYDEKGNPKVNTEANLIAHAILGAVVAELQGNSALAGGVGAVTGEVAADIIRKTLYDDKPVKDLSEADKQNISALAQLASGLAVAAGSGGDIGDTGTAVAGSKNAVENNAVALLRIGWQVAKPGTIGESVTITVADVLMMKGLSAFESEAFLNSLTLEQQHLIKLALVDPRGNQNLEDAVQKTYDLYYEDYRKTVTANSDSSSLNQGNALSGNNVYDEESNNDKDNTHSVAGSGSVAAGGAPGFPPDDDDDKEKSNQTNKPPKTLQSGGNTINQNTADKLNQNYGTNYHRRDWGRALEELKKDFNLRNDHHGKILSNGDYMSGAGRIIGNIADYLP